MSDITRDDLRKMVDIDYRGNSPRQETVEVTDEEFARLAREAGYISLDDLMQRHIDIMSLFPGLFPEKSQRRLLRALLTDECEPCGGDGYTVEPSATGIGSFEQKCPDCGGRGWLPKDAMRVTVTVTEYLMDHGLGSYPIDVVIALADGVVRALLAEWLEADHE